MASAANGVISASNGSVNGALGPGDLLRFATQGWYYEDYEITGIPAGQAVEVRMTAGFDTYLEVVDRDKIGRAHV